MDSKQKPTMKAHNDRFLQPDATSFVSRESSFESRIYLLRVTEHPINEGQLGPYFSLINFPSSEIVRSAVVCGEIISPSNKYDMEQANLNNQTKYGTHNNVVADVTTLPSYLPHHESNAYNDYSERREYPHQEKSATVIWGAKFIISDTA